MKHLLLVLVCTLTASSALANSDQLYCAIQAPEVDARPVFGGMPGDGAEILSKSVGGLTCTKTQVIYPGAMPTFKCKLSSKGMNPELIYHSLSVSEVDARPRINGEPEVGAEIFAKRIGGLECAKTTYVHPNARPKFECSVTF